MSLYFARAYGGAAFVPLIADADQGFIPVHTGEPAPCPALANIHRVYPRAYGGAALSTD